MVWNILRIVPALFVMILAKGKFFFSLESLGAGEEVSFSYPVTMTSTKRNSTRGKIWLHGVELSANDNDIRLNALASIGVDVSGTTAQSDMTVLQANGGWNELGRLKIHMEKDNVGQNALILTTPTNRAGKGPELQINLEVYETSILASDSKGKLNEQTVSLKKQLKELFKYPAFLEINLDDYIDLNNIPAGQEPYVATYDETNKIWVKVPILEQNLENNSVTVEAAHFSTWGAGLGSSLPQNGANVLLFDQPYTSLFTGAAHYSIPIWTPPGRAGMQPDLSLSYSSGTLDGVLGDVQAPWVGMGWNMDGVEIVREITTSETGYGYENSFALTINGTLYDLTVNPEHPNQYYTKRSSFLRIERHNFALGNQEDPLTGESPNLNNQNQGNINVTGEWWEVVTTDGTRYRLGWNTDSQQLALMYGYSCTTGENGCTTPNGAYASSGYAGLGTNLVALRWRVDKVEDLFGNYMTYTYEEKQPASALIPQFDRASFISEIKYTGHASLTPKYIVKFNYETRPGDIPVEFNVWDNWENQLLKTVQICYENCASNNIVRTYTFGYAVQNVPNNNGTLTLTDLTISSGNFTATGVSSSPITSPKIKFTYENKPNRAVSGGSDAYTYPRLVKIENGYGGSLNYTYEHDGRGTNSWYNYRVKTVNVLTGDTTPAAAIRGYAYSTPVYTGTDNLGGLIGYTDVTETTYDFNGTTKLADTAHHFGTVGLDTGYELVTESKDPAGNVLQKSISTYVTDNSQAPFLGWNYRYLYQAENYVRSGSTLTLTSKTRWVREGNTGNLSLQEDYLGNTLYRRHLYEYHPFTANVHILDKVTRQILVDASNSLISDTRFVYDNGDTDLSEGKLTLVQRLLNATQTSDTTYAYDAYGNVTQTCVYTALGTLNSAPSGGICSQVTYDDVIHTYPRVSVNPLGQTSTTEYIYQLGMPYQVVDQNQWVTSTVYDRLGRTLTVTPPGLTTAGVKYTYPIVSGESVASPYNVKMELWDQQAGVYRPVWGIYDGMARMLQTQTLDTDRGDLLVSETQYNAQGLAARQSLPFYAAGSNGGVFKAGAVQFTETTYDALGRAIQVTSPGNIIAYTQYNGLTTTSIDPNGNKVARITDGFGRLKYIHEYSGNTIYATSVFTYDTADRLTKTTDARNNVSELTYDDLGRKTGMTDPDMGTWMYQYDALGNLLAQTDARGCVLQFAYDNLNRIKSKTNAGTNCGLPTDVDYFYDSDNPSTGNYDPIALDQFGFRTKMTDPSGSTKWEYSNYGRTVIERRTIGSVPEKSSTTASDWLGRVLSVQYPDNQTVFYKYDALGRAKSFGANAAGNDLASIGYNQLSQIMNVNMGNGARIENQYDMTTHRLDNRSAFKGNSTFLDFDYQYDPAGNITQLTDHVLDETHTYQYDFLNRLTSAEAVNDTDFAYRQTFEYDKVGNILSRQDWEVSDLIFKDDFEGTTPSGWSATVSDPNEIWTIASNGFTPVSGERSVVFDIRDNNSLYLEDTTPASGGDETRYRARFYFNPNSIVPATSDILELFAGYKSNGTQVLRVQFQKSAGNLQIRVGALSDAGAWNDSAWQTVANQWTSIEVDYRTAANAGTLELWLDGVSTLAVSSVDNDTNTINKARLGVLGVDGTRGQVLYDAFESHHSGYIGVVPQQMAYNGYILAPVAYHAPASSGLNAVSDAPMLQAQNTDTPIPTPVTPTITPTIPTATETPSPTATETGTSTPVPTRILDTSTPSITPTTPTPTKTATNTPTPSKTPTSSKTPTPSKTYTPSRTFTPSRTPTPITNTPTKTFTATNTFTATSTPTVSNTPVTFTATLNPVSAIFLSFDEANVSDSLRTPEASDGSLAGGAEIVPGFGTYAVRFNGGRVSIPRKAEMEPTNGFSIGLWVLPTEKNQGETYVILSKGGSAEDYKLYINTNGFLVFRVSDLSPSELVGPMLDLNKWTYVRAIYDRPAKLLKLYLNDVLVASRSVTGGISYNTAGGLVLSDVTDPFSGMVDEFSFSAGTVSDEALASTAVAFNTMTQAPTFTQTNTPIPPTPTPSRTPTNTRTPTAGSSPTPSPVLSPTPSTTPIPTLDPSDDPQWGTGSDGSLIVATATTYNINVDHLIDGRTCADAVAYNVTSLGSTAAVVNSDTVEGCLSVGDEVLLINLQGTSASSYNTGAYEFLHVESITNGQGENANDTVVFESSKLRWYGEGWRNDYNIGTGANQQKVMLMRVPNYYDLTVNGTLTANAWDGLKYGVIAYRVRGTLTGTGSINANGKGFSGGAGGNAYYAAGYWHGDPGNDGGGIGKAFTGGGGGGEGGDHNGGTPGPNGDPEHGSGAGYGTAGVSVDGNTAGKIYGLETLEFLYAGSGGGGGGANDQSGSHGGKGGDGGGIILVNAYSISFGGTIVSNGGTGGADAGGGSGGSIRIEGDLISINALNALGGSGGGGTGAGGKGRIAVYYKSTPPTVTSQNPARYEAVIGSVPPAPPAPTPINLTPTPMVWSTGDDGDLEITTGTTFNIHTQTQNSARVCSDGGDGVSYFVTSLNSSWATLSHAPGAGCLNMGDEILLINLHGISTNYGNVGNYEFLHVANVTGSTVYFSEPKTKYYGDNTTDDSNVGTTYNQQNVMIIRVPNYNKVVVNGTLTGNPWTIWSANSSGVIVFRAKAQPNGAGLEGSGVITATGLGFNGGIGGASYYSGGYLQEDDGNPGVGIGPANTGGGYGGNGGHDHAATSGNGGGYGLKGGGTGGGKVYGVPQLTSLYLGSGGGGGGAVNQSGSNGGDGGDGGGIIFILAETVSFTGSIVSNGSGGSGPANGGEAGGGGSGGSIRIEGDEIGLNTVAANGQVRSGAGSGAMGRIAVYYLADNGFTGSFTPGYLEKAGEEDSIFSNDFESGDLAGWISTVNDSGDLGASDSADYWHNYGLSAAIDDAVDIFVRNDSTAEFGPENEKEYRARFYVNPNGLAMASGDALDLLTGHTTSTAVFHVQLQKVTTAYTDDGDAALQYSGNWSMSSLAGTYGGTHTKSTTVGDSMSYTFNGDRLTLYYLRNTNGGMMDIYIDGIKVDSVNQYNATTIFQDTWTSSILKNATHTVKLVHASGTTVFFDALQVFNIYQVRAGLLSDAGTWSDSNWYDVSGEWNAVEIDYQALINDGNLTLWLNGVQKQVILHVDNDTRTITEARLGAQGIETTTHGTVYFDDFESRRFSYIGTLPDPGVSDPQATNPKGWETTKFEYEGTAIAGTPYPQPHAVTKLVSPDPDNPTNPPTELAAYEYDENGNMTCRMENGDTFKQFYNAENRISAIHKMSGGCTGTATESWTYTYDGDGVRVSTAYFTAANPNPQVFTAYFMGGSFEVNGSVNGSAFTETGTKSYYAIAGMMVAMKDSTGVQYLLTDHLGSIVATTDSNGSLISQQRYLPFGGARTDVTGPSASPTDFTYTGQRDLPGTGLMDYKARMFSPYINRFLQPDSIIPDLSNPQSWNRYS